MLLVYRLSEKQARIEIQRHLFGLLHIKDNDAVVENIKVKSIDLTSLSLSTDSSASVSSANTGLNVPH